LRQISNPPVALFCQGNVAVLDDVSIAIVGSRSASARACQYTRHLAADLAQLGYGIVSGLARGIDAAAHQGACDAGGKTVAVVGNGTDVVYPPEHIALQRTIRGTGCVLSELPPGTAPRAWHFPSRNRILAGLVRGVLVVQAEQRSGALITARHALEENREVMAVPGDVEDARSKGAHALLRQGATLVESAADVVAAIGGKTASRLDGREADRQALLALLQRPRSAESLRAALGWQSPTVMTCLTELELIGLVGKDARGRFRRLRSLSP
jgi:DNA processing protein